MAVTSGAAQSVALSLSGQPVGVTGAFSPSTVTAGGSSTLTLTVTTSADSNLLVSFRLPVVSVSFSVTCSPPETPPLTSRAGRLPPAV